MKKIFLILLTAIMMLLAVACQATPDEVVVVQKDTDRLIEQAQDENSGTGVSELEVPEQHYTYSKTASDGRLVINVDAPVSLPEAGKIPTAKVSEGGFSQDQVYGFFKYLFGDEKVYIDTDTGNTPRTKSELEELIISYKKYLAEGTTDENLLLNAEETEEAIALMEKEIQTVPETIDKSGPVLTDGTLYSSEVDINGTPLPVMHLQATSENASISVTIPKDKHGAWETYFYWGNMPDTEYAPNEASAVKLDENTASEATKGKINLSLEDAKAFCEGFFAAGSINDVVLSEVYLLDNGWDEEDGNSHTADTYTYKLIYVRTVNEMPTCNFSSVIANRDEASIPWEYEKIIIYANDSGYSIDWIAHTELGEIINEDTGVMPFEKAQMLFENMIEVVYAVENEDQTTNINIDSVSLTLVRIREQNGAAKSGIYTPAWVFKGSIAQTYADGFESSKGVGESIPILVINAIDGSIIDLEKGY